MTLTPRTCLELSGFESIPYYHLLLSVVTVIIHNTLEMCQHECEELLLTSQLPSSYECISQIRNKRNLSNVIAQAVTEAGLGP